MISTPEDRPPHRPWARLLRPRGRWAWQSWAWESWAGFGLGLLLTGLVWWLLGDQNDRLAQSRFQSRARDLTGDIVSRLGAYEQMLHGGVAMMNVAGGRATREDWRIYVSGLHVEERYPGIQGIGYAKRVPAGDREPHEAATRAEGFHSYAVQPDGVRAEYFPVTYLEPFASRNLRAFGYDMHSEPVRRAAMERARATGSAAATGKVRLVQETDRDVQAGFLIYVPVYDLGRPLGTAAERHEALLGFVYSPFRMNDLMRATIDSGMAEGLDLRIYDGDSTEPEALLFAKDSGHRPRFQDVRRIDVSGRPWTLRIASDPAFEASMDTATPRAVLVAGVIISLLLVSVINSVLQDRDRMAELRRSYDALARARAEAEEANAAKSRFLAAASHDLRQPLQTLGIYLHMIGLQLTGERAQGPGAAKLVDAARDAFDATQRMLNSLLDLAMLETGVIRPRLDEVDLPAFLARIGEDIRVEAADKGLAFRASSCDARVTTDPAMLERILRNLLNNALKYTPTGTIRLTCRAGAEFVTIKVQDTGPGIPRDRMHLIFEDFYQIGNPERDRRKGLGLGLATVARLTRLLGYRLRVLSRPGRGAVFMVELPRNVRPPVARDGETAAASPLTAPRREGETRTQDVAGDVAG